MMKTDIEIAQECMMEPITKVAEKAGIPEEYLEQYGKYKAKIDYNFLKKSDKEISHRNGYCYTLHPRRLSD